MAQTGLRDKFFVATKLWTSGAAQGVRQMEESFRLLRVARMDLMQVHNLTDVATHARTLGDWKARGRVRYVGITHYSSYAYPEVERLLRAGGWDFLQINYSLDEREAETRLLPLAHDKGVAVIANRPFASGAMFRRVRGRPLPPWAAEIGVASWAQYFLKWIVGHPAITCAIPATAKAAHMQDNLAASLGALPDAALRERMATHYDSL
jgi:diketogulonate reductase-like aldo/keto reductase